MSALIAYGDQLLSLFKTATVSIGTIETDAPIARMTNGTMGQNVGFAETTAAGYVDLGVAQAPDFAAVFNHNFSGATVRVQASAATDFSVLIVNAVMTVAPGRFWLDLRSLSPRTARYWRLHVAGNAYAVRFGEFVVFTAGSLRNHRWDYTDVRRYLQYTLGDSEYGANVREVLGTGHQRGRRALFWGPRDMAETIRAVSRFAMVWPGPVLLIPEETDTDIWFLDWTDELAKVTDVDNFYQFEIELPEHSPGVLLPVY